MKKTAPRFSEARVAGLSIYLFLYVYIYLPISYRNALTQLDGAAWFLLTFLLPNIDIIIASSLETQASSKSIIFLLFKLGRKSLRGASSCDVLPRVTLKGYDLPIFGGREDESIERKHSRTEALAG